MEDTIQDTPYSLYKFPLRILCRSADSTPFNRRFFLISDPCRSDQLNAPQIVQVHYTFHFAVLIHHHQRRDLAFL